MKKIIFIISLALFVFTGCEKKEQVKPKSPEPIYLSIELYGAYMGQFFEDTPLVFSFVRVTEIDYSINLNVNGVNHLTRIQNTLKCGFVGTVYDKQIKLLTKDKLKIEVTNNKPIDYFYLRVYSNPYNIKTLKFENSGKLEIDPKDFL